jgi:hypothetical protein
MKKPLSVGAASSFIGMSTMTLSGGQLRDTDNAVRERFVECKVGARFPFWNRVLGQQAFHRDNIDMYGLSQR